MKYPNLFKPLIVNGMILQNRIIASPCSDFMQDKAIGGAAMLIWGSASVDNDKSALVSNPYMFDKHELTKTSHIIRIMKQGGAKASLQLTHGGQFANYIKGNAWGPVDFVRSDGTVVEAMNEDMMRQVAANFGKSALEAKTSGFDMVMLDFAHGFLPTQFMSPYFNQRTDDYGGSYENRMRFPKMILNAVREAIGPDYPIDLRVSSCEWVKGGILEEDVIRFVVESEHLIDMVHVSSGLDCVLEGNVHAVTTSLQPHLKNVTYAANMKKAVKNIPVVCVGAILTPEEAEHIIASGQADAIALGRTLIADPFWPLKALEGKEDDIVPCLRCSQCYHIATKRRNVGCAVNPRFKNHDFVPLELAKSSHKKRVVVIGGGPGGMKAALTASLRGHEVILFEKENQLGGALKFSDYDERKQDIRRYKEYLKCQISKSDIEVRLNTAATVELITGLKADILIIAAGAKSKVPKIPGIENVSIRQAVDVYPFLEDIQQPTAIIGGGTIGSELAIELAVRGVSVNLVEISDTLAVQGNLLYRERLRQEMEGLSCLHRHLRTSCSKIQRDGIFILNEEGAESFIPVQNIILAAGMEPDKECVNTFLNLVPRTYLVGDCSKPGTVYDAVCEGYFSIANL